MLLSFFIVNCSTDTEPIIDKKKPFFSLHIGDIRQYFDNKELYGQIKITDTLRRADGKKVFEFEESYLISNDIFKGTNYYFIEDNFFKETSLDTIKNPDLNLDNPFNEQKLAQLYPQDGVTFLRNYGASDSTKLYFHIKLLDTLKTKYKVFNDIAKYEVISPSLKGASYYAFGYGHIGSTLINGNDTLNLFITYLKVNDKEIGEYNKAFGNRVLNSYKLNKSLLELLQNKL